MNGEVNVRHYFVANSRLIRREASLLPPFFYMGRYTRVLRAANVRAQSRSIEAQVIQIVHDAGDGLKDPTAPISTLRRSGHPYPHNKIHWEYNELRGENGGPFKGQQASASNPVMYMNLGSPFNLWNFVCFALGFGL